MAQTSIQTGIGPVRFSYLHVFEPHAFDPNAGEEKKRYSAVLLIPKSNTELVAKIKEAIQKAYEASVSEVWGNKRPVLEKVTCLRDGDEPKDDGEDRGEAYKGMYFLNAKSKSKPVIIDKNNQPIEDPEELYSGSWGAAIVAFSGWVFGGKPGISCFLNLVKKGKDGERLGGDKSFDVDDLAGIDFGDDEL